MAQVIASAVNRNSAIPHRQFRSRVRHYADSRRAELQRPEVWQRMEFGEALLAQMDRRRTNSPAAG